MVFRKDAVCPAGRVLYHAWNCTSPFCIGAVNFFQNITSFMLDVIMIIAFCIFSLKGTIN